MVTTFTFQCLTHSSPRSCTAVHSTEGKHSLTMARRCFTLPPLRMTKRPAFGATVRKDVHRGVDVVESSHSQDSPKLCSGSDPPVPEDEVDVDIWWLVGATFCNPAIPTSTLFPPYFHSISTLDPRFHSISTLLPL